ncbi:MAG TPA: SPOR domain-containing protein [Caulobacteraceae bacterium]|jgi:hypothetical protein|nr:SPOR domain-containing protein [Caulobacteraceae bacterium]
MSLGVRAGVLGLLMGATIASGAGAAPSAFPAFPASETTPQIGRWLAGQTDLAPASVVLVGPGYVFSYVTPDPPSESGGLVWKQAREEVTNVIMASRLNGRSATATLAFDCAHNSATASNVVIYAGNNLKGDEGRAMPASDWLVANPGLYLMDLAKAACDRGFHGPYATSASLASAAPVAAPPLRATPAARAAMSSVGPVHWVQVGAFASPAAANAHWREIQRLLPAQSDGRAIRLESAGHDGKTLLRALAGPFHGSDARGFCAALKFRGGDCLVR